jgi:hypothetical protein
MGIEIEQIKKGTFDVRNRKQKDNAPSSLQYLNFNCRQNIYNTKT